MRSSSLIASLAASALLSGCFLIPASEEEEDQRTGFHDVTISWKLKNLDGSVMSSCPAGFTNLYIHMYKSGYVEPEDAFQNIPCTPTGSITAKLATGGKLMDPESRDLAVHAWYEYDSWKDIWIDVTEETLRVTAATSSLHYIPNLTSDTSIDFDIYPAGGIPVVTWQLDSTLTGATLASCASAGVDTIEYAHRLWDDMNAPLVVHGSWPCTNVDPEFYYDPDGNSTLLSPDDPKLGSGHVTKAFAPETYFVELRAKRNGQVVGTTTEASFVSEKGNTPHRVLGAQIRITDR